MVTPPIHCRFPITIFHSQRISSASALTTISIRGDIYWNEWVHGIMVGIALATAAGSQRHDSSSPVGRVGLDAHENHPPAPCHESLRRSRAVRDPEVSAIKASAICQGHATPRPPSVHNYLCAWALSSRLIKERSQEYLMRTLGEMRL